MQLLLQKNCLEEPERGLNVAMLSIASQVAFIERTQSVVHTHVQILLQVIQHTCILNFYTTTKMDEHIIMWLYRRFTLGTYKFTYVDMEPFSITWNPSPCKPCILLCTKVTHLHPLFFGARVGPPRTRVMENFESI
jgi:hypothetical protein